MAAAQAGKSVLLVDANAQGASISFRATRSTDDIQAIQVATPTLHKDVVKFNQYMIFIDAGGRDTKTFRSAIMAADLLLIPCLPPAVDFWAASDVVDILGWVRSLPYPTTLYPTHP